MFSELSNALNPNVVTRRQRRPPVPESTSPPAAVLTRPHPDERRLIQETVSPPVDVVLQHPRPNVPHRSELELAITHIPPPPQPGIPPPQPIVPSQTHADLVRQFQSRFITALQAERQRRDDWQYEQEQKQTQRHTELEQQIHELRQELALLKSQNTTQSNASAIDPTTPATGVTTGGHTMPNMTFTAGSLPQSTSHNLDGTSSEYSEVSERHTPLSADIPRGEPQPYFLPQDVDDVYPLCDRHGGGSSLTPPLGFHVQIPEQSNPILEHVARMIPSLPGASARILCPDGSEINQHVLPEFVQGSSSGSSALPKPLSPAIVNSLERISPAPSEACDSPSPHPTPSLPHSTSSLNPRKRPTSAGRNHESGEQTDDSSGGESETRSTGRSRKRKNGHDDRILTIHHALRKHILQMMELENDLALPDSYTEGIQPPSDAPLRFVWGKTPRQSAHNAAMKQVVINDIIAHRQLYKHVPDKNFSKKALDSAFDQVFTTFRQKAKTQKDASAASQLKRREDQKAMKARRLGRKKLKLANRLEALKQLQGFSDPAFDGALQQDYMSSEESCDEEFYESPDNSSQQRTQVLIVRGLPWRSLRLLRFYAVLDEEDRADKSTKPKRGVGRRERRQGPYKDGGFMPPAGIASWMVSKKWLRLVQMTRPDLSPLLPSLIIDAPTPDWSHFILLGPESDDELELEQIVPALYIPVSETSYALQNALTPMLP